MRFARWLCENSIADECAEEVYNNTSAIRDGNRLDIHDDYIFDDEEKYEISFLYVENAILYTVIYNNESDEFVGKIEIYY